MPCNQVNLEGQTALVVHWSEDGKATSVEVRSSSFATAEGIILTARCTN